MKTIIITGVDGQDGFLMCEYLLKNTDNLVIGLGFNNTSKNITENFKYFPYIDITDVDIIENIVQKHKPDYFINFAGVTKGGGGWESNNVLKVNLIGVEVILKILLKHSHNCKFLNAGSIEEFGTLSPYSISKISARNLINAYYDKYSLFGVQPYLGNHESCYRGESFLTKKITKSISKIKKGEIESFQLGNLDDIRDWSDAEDFMDAIWKIINSNNRKPYVLQSGTYHTIREFVELSFMYAGYNGMEWVGSGFNETYNYDGKILLSINPEYYRSRNDIIPHLIETPKELGWEPKTSFKQLIHKMIMHDLNN